MKLSSLILVLAVTQGTLWAQTSTPHRLAAVPIQQVVIHDDFWSPKLELWQNVTVPDCFTKFENDHGGAINNFDRVAEGKTGHHAGPQWYDGLIYEMIRASADFLAAHPDPKLKQQVDGYIARIAAAANHDPDGYIETWTELMEPNHRWGLNGGNDVSQHELYNAGALINAGIHWYRATGETNLLQVAVRMANDMCAVMGPPPKVNQVPGHSLGEEALVNLYLLFTGHPELKAQMTVPVREKDYLNLAQFWIDHRGNHQGRALNWESYAQDDMPVVDQKEMEGHAVRDALLCTGLAAAGDVTGREDYLNSAQRLWNNMVHCKMYLTGGLGAEAAFEGFGHDYYLPNGTAYAETCAAAAGGFFGQNMNLTYADAQYADLLERELFNAALVGVGLNGDSYFYDNPLATDANHRRWSWHSCPCCPPMFLKLMSGLPGCIYAEAPNAIYVNQFIGSQAVVPLGGKQIKLQQTTEYPWNGRIKIAVEPAKPCRFDLFIRIPAWCQGTSSSNDLYEILGRPQGGAATLKVNGRTVRTLDMVRGYARLHRHWKSGDVVELNLDMPVREVRANPKVQADRGLVALTRGPIVYCAESVDNPEVLPHFVVSPSSVFTTEFEPDLLGGVTVIKGRVQARQDRDGKTTLRPAELTAVPYYASANRQPDSMRVWLPAESDHAAPITLATDSRVSASHCWHLDSVDAVNDGLVPAKSSDTSKPRLTWWDHKGTAEWAELDFPKPATVSRTRVFWFADRPAKGGCDLPKDWSLLYRDGNAWKPVEPASSYGIEADQFNDVTFTPVTTTAMRLQVQLKPDWSAGIYEWELE